jgi:hypothetical protein
VLVLAAIASAAPPLAQETRLGNVPAGATLRITREIAIPANERMVSFPTLRRAYPGETYGQADLTCILVLPRASRERRVISQGRVFRVLGERHEDTSPVYGLRSQSRLVPLGADAGKFVLHCFRSHQTHGLAMTSEMTLGDLAAHRALPFQLDVSTARPPREL